jgi:hypothetical protein
MNDKEKPSADAWDEACQAAIPAIKTLAKIQEQYAWWAECRVQEQDDEKEETEAEAELSSLLDEITEPDFETMADELETSANLELPELPKGLQAPPLAKSRGLKLKTQPPEPTGLYKKLQIIRGILQIESGLASEDEQDIEVLMEIAARIFHRVTNRLLANNQRWVSSRRTLKKNND